MSLNHEQCDELLGKLLDEGVLGPLDVHFARFLAGIAPCSGEIKLLFALVSSSAASGHICLHLEDIHQLFPLDKHGAQDVLTDIGQVCGELLENRAAGAPGEYKPIILDGTRLYLYRYWDYERNVVINLKERAKGSREDLTPGWLKERLDQYFPGGNGEGDVDWQKVAAVMAVMNNFSIISGGPGTGKTTTVAKVLALLIEQSPLRKPKIALAAPTGKAAARLQEAIREVRETLTCPPAVKELIPEETHTIHRLLGTIRGSPYFRYNKDNTLPADVVIIDEASMIDIALLSKLLDALDKETKLILLGDKDQLASVEPGAVLGDICNAGDPLQFSEAFARLIGDISGIQIPAGFIDSSIPQVQNHIVHLRRSYRYRDDSGIGALSRAVNDGDGDRALKTLKHDQSMTLSYMELPDRKKLKDVIRENIPERFIHFVDAGDLEGAFSAFESFRILSALREGPYGVYALNRLIEEVLEEKGLISLDELWYKGKPIMVTMNDYTLKLFNGDIGITAQDDKGSLMVFFKGSNGAFRAFPPARLPEHESVYAMTVHKSQGSEFDGILFVLLDSDSPILTRELVYTAITRAKNHITIMAHEDTLKKAVLRRVSRKSGLNQFMRLI